MDDTDDAPDENQDAVGGIESLFERAEHEESVPGSHSERTSQTRSEQITSLLIKIDACDEAQSAACHQTMTQLILILRDIEDDELETSNEAFAKLTRGLIATCERLTQTHKRHHDIMMDTERLLIHLVENPQWRDLSARLIHERNLLEIMTNLYSADVVRINVVIWLVVSDLHANLLEGRTRAYNLPSTCLAALQRMPPAGDFPRAVVENLCRGHEGYRELARYLMEPQTRVLGTLKTYAAAVIANRLAHCASSPAIFCAGLEPLKSVLRTGGMSPTPFGDALAHLWLLDSDGAPDSTANEASTFLPPLRVRRMLCWADCVGDMPPDGRSAATWATAIVGLMHMLEGDDAAPPARPKGDPFIVTVEECVAMLPSLTNWLEAAPNDMRAWVYASRAVQIIHSRLACNDVLQHVEPLAESIPRLLRQAVIFHGTHAAEEEAVRVVRRLFQMMLDAPELRQFAWQPILTHGADILRLVSARLDVLTPEEYMVVYAIASCLVYGEPSDTASTVANLVDRVPPAGPLEPGRSQHCSWRLSHRSHIFYMRGCRLPVYMAALYRRLSSSASTSSVLPTARPTSAFQRRRQRTL